MRAAKDQNQWNAKPDRGPASTSAADANNREAAICLRHDESDAFDAHRREKVDVDRISGGEPLTDQYDDRPFALCESAFANR